MSKLFPSMHSKPEKIQIISILPCWLWVFVLLPMYMPFVGLGIWEQVDISSWLDIVYHVLNAVLMLVVISRYLQDDWFMFSADPLSYLKHIALTVGLMAAVEFVLLRTMYLIGCNMDYMLEGLPVVELSIALTPRYLVITEPIWGTLSMVVCSPISICALFYCLGFSPVCYKKTWLAYVSVAVLTLIPPIIDILWRSQADLTLSMYIVQLPIHLLACWSYQKTDNVWTPLLSLTAANLLSSIVLLML